MTNPSKRNAADEAPDSVMVTTFDHSMNQIKTTDSLISPNEQAEL